MVVEEIHQLFVAVVVVVVAKEYIEHLSPYLKGLIRLRSAVVELREVTETLPVAVQMVMILYLIR